MLKINDKEIGEGKPIFIIGEIGINHDNDINKAKHLINVCVDAGVSAVKTQMWRTSSLMIPKAENFELIKHLEPSKEFIRELKNYCDEKKIMFLCTPDDEESLDFLVDELRVPAIKVGSGELNNLPFLRKIAEKNLPTVLSTGMGTLEEVEEAVNVFKEANNIQLVLLHCTSSYPCPLKDVNLLAMKSLESFGYPVGYSDHTIGLLASVFAVLMGAKVIEKHMTYDKQASGPDHKASLNPDELKELVLQIRRAELLLGSGEKVPVNSEVNNLVRARRSIVAGRDLYRGELLCEEDLSFKRPGNGIPPNELSRVIGKRLNRNILEDEQIKEKDIE